MKPEMTVNVPVKIFGFGIADALFQFHTFCLLGGHVDAHIGRDTVLLVRQPLNGAGIAQGTDSGGSATEVNLAVLVHHYKLGNHICHASHFPVS